MASIFKRGKYYYITFYRVLDDGSVQWPTKSLGIKHKNLAKDALYKLEELYRQKEIDPFKPNFNPKQVLVSGKNEKAIKTVHEKTQYRTPVSKWMPQNAA